MKILETYQYNAGDGPVVYRRGIQTEYEEMRSGVYLAKLRVSNNNNNNSNFIELSGFSSRLAKQENYWSNQFKS